MGAMRCRRVHRTRAPDEDWSIPISCFVRTSPLASASKSLGGPNDEKTPIAGAGCCFAGKR